MKTCAYFVTKGNVPCTLLNVSGLARGGVLMPGLPVMMFTKKRDADRAVERSDRIAENITGTLIEAWARERAPQIFDKSESYVIVPLAVQTKTPLAKAPAAKK